MRPSSLHKAGTELSASVRRSPSVKVSDLLIINGTCPNPSEPRHRTAHVADPTNSKQQVTTGPTRNWLNFGHGM